MVNIGDSLQYYDQYARELFDSTRDVEFTQVQDRLLGYLKPGARTLDFGCGLGRDAKYFINRGRMADAAGGPVELVKTASEYTSVDARQMFSQDPDEREIYEGIWTYSSILHLIFDELAGVSGKMHRALVSCGVPHTFFKYGIGEGEWNSRHFMDMAEEKAEGLLKIAHGFATLEIQVMSDMRPGRDEKRWPNMILRKR